MMKVGRLMKPQDSEPSSNSLLKALGYTKKEFIDLSITLLNIIGLLAAFSFMYWGFKHNIFTSESALRDLLDTLGASAPYGFMLLQTVQTVIPIIPSSVTIPMGIIIFGASYGFLLNFVGVMIGSLINFILARKHGRPLVEMLVPKQKMAKYIGWLDEKSRFNKIFTFGMFFPISPANILCYLAGLSNMSFKRFFLTLSLGKPLTLFIYSYGLMTLIEGALQIFT